MTERGVAAWLALVGASTLVSCGGGDEGDPPTVREVVRTAMRAFEARDADMLCENLSRRAQVVIGHAAHGDYPIDCRVDVRKYFKWLVADSGGEPRLTAVSKPAAGRAIATVRLPDGELVRLPLSRDDGRWRLDGLFDASLSRIQVTSKSAEQRLIERNPTPTRLARAGAVSSASTAGGTPCPAVDLRRFPELSGGCQLEADPTPFDLTVQTPFGTMDFARCRVEYDLVVDGHARAWLSGMVFVGDSPCLDAMTCRSQPLETVPWPATVHRGRGGKLNLRVDDVCIDTCVGRFTGSWDASMTKRPRGWRLRSTDAMVGRTGWTMTGAVEATGEPVSFSTQR